MVRCFMALPEKKKALSVLLQEWSYNFCKRNHIVFLLSVLSSCPVLLNAFLFWPRSMILFLLWPKKTKGLLLTWKICTRT